MKGLAATLFCFVVLFLSFVSADYYVPPDPTQELWFTQTFDHFNDTDDRTFQQRYLIYDNFYNYSSSSYRPLFFCPGGEADVYGGYEHNGFMFEFGKKVGAFQLFPEHRFYGESVPFSVEESYSPDNLSKLTIEQALEDYIAIIAAVIDNYQLPSDIPIIAFGGSYPGELAAFLRIKYPQVIDGSLAASAPVRYHPFIENGTPSGAFYRVITRDFATYDTQCPMMVQTAFAEMIDNFNSGDDGVQQVQQDLMLCDPLDNTDDQLRLVNLWIENAFASLGMENYPYAYGDFPPFPLFEACNTFKSAYAASNSYTHALGQATGQFYNASGTLTCFNITEEYYPCADITGCGGGVGDTDAMSWDYQSCTEIIANVDTNNVTDMFPFAQYDFVALSQYCMNQWQVLPTPRKIPEMFPYDTSSKIIFSNGLLDPWFPGGVPNSIGTEIVTIHMKSAAHHLDLRGSSDEDPEDVKEARLFESEILSEWIAYAFAQNEDVSIDRSFETRFSVVLDELERSQQ